jgi:hypothetical protein
MNRFPKVHAAARGRGARGRNGAQRAALAIAVLGAALGALALWPAPARALINPRYTVVDRMRERGMVLVLRASAPHDGRRTAEVVETLAGDAPAEKKLIVDFSNAEDLADDKVTGAFGGAPSTLTIGGSGTAVTVGALTGGTAHAVEVNGTGAYTVNGAGTFTGGTTLKGGCTVNLGASTVGTYPAVTSGPFGTGTITLDTSVNIVTFPTV